MRAERIDIKKRDWVETDCQNCGSSKYSMDIDAGQHSDDAPVITYDCEDCGNQDPPD